MEEKGRSYLGSPGGQMGSLGGERTLGSVGLKGSEGQTHSREDERNTLQSGVCRAVSSWCVLVLSEGRKVVRAGVIPGAVADEPCGSRSSAMRGGCPALRAVSDWGLGSKSHSA